MPYYIEGYSLGPRDLILLKYMYKKDPQGKGLDSNDIWKIISGKMFQAKSKRVYIYKNKAILYERLNLLEKKGLITIQKERPYKYKLNKRGKTICKLVIERYNKQISQ